MRKHIFKTGLLVVFLLLAAMFIDSCSKDSTVELNAKNPAKVGRVGDAANIETQSRKAPGFQLADVTTGSTVDWSQFDGKVVLVDFWATWCPPCRRSIPDLSSLQVKYANKGFAVVGISLDQTGPEKVAQFAKQMQIPYKVVIGNAQVAGDWNIGSAIPVAFLVDRKGEIVDRFVGLQDKTVLEQRILKYL